MPAMLPDRTFLLFITLFCISTVFALSDHPVDSDKWTDEYDRHFRKYSKRYFGPLFDWHWFKAQAIAESNLNANAVSHVGARGLMQIMPDTFKEITDKNPHFAEVDHATLEHCGRAFITIVFYTGNFLRRRSRTDCTWHSPVITPATAGFSMLRENCKPTAPLWQQVKPYMPRETRAYVSRIKTLMGV